jgi:hypothetical protein
LVGIGAKRIPGRGSRGIGGLVGQRGFLGQRSAVEDMCVKRVLFAVPNLEGKDWFQLLAAQITMKYRD